MTSFQIIFNLRCLCSAVTLLRPYISCRPRPARPEIYCPIQSSVRQSTFPPMGRRVSESCATTHQNSQLIIDENLPRTAENRPMSHRVTFAGTPKHTVITSNLSEKDIHITSTTGGWHVRTCLPEYGGICWPSITIVPAPITEPLPIRAPVSTCATTFHVIWHKTEPKQRQKFG